MAGGAVASALFQVSPDLLQSLRTAWEAANNRWNQWVLNYTQNRQLDLLKGLGYTALKANDGAGALAVIQSGARVDLLCTDVVMPGPLRSPDLARKARERLPDLAVLFTSGYTENAIVHGGRLDPGVDLLGKPYTREALAQKVRQVLAQRTGGYGEASAAPGEPENGD